MLEIVQLCKCEVWCVCVCLVCGDVLVMCGFEDVWYDVLVFCFEYVWCVLGWWKCQRHIASS